MGLYKFEMEWYDDYKETEETNSGFVCANTYAEAMENLTHHVNNNNIINIRLENVNYDCNNVVYVDEPVALEVVRKANNY